jgi:hypothetical protein
MIREVSEEETCIEKPSDVFCANRKQFLDYLTVTRL